MMPRHVLVSSFCGNIKPDGYNKSDRESRGGGLKSMQGKVNHKVLSIILLFILSITVIAKGDGNAGDSPEWIKLGKPVHPSDIPSKDYSYLAQWLDKNSKPVHDYFIYLFDKHQIIIYGEQHNVKEHKDFILDLIPELYHKAGVRCIGMEMIRHSSNDALEKLVTAPEFDKKEALRFACNQCPDWNSKEHWDFIETVWRLNKSLKPGEEKMRVIGLCRDIDWIHYATVSSKPQDSADFKQMLAEMSDYDAVMAEQVEKEMIQKKQKGLVFVGRCHDYTHYELPPNYKWGVSRTMGNLLYKKYKDRIFQVWPGSAWNPTIEKAMDLRGQKLIGFDVDKSPFATILTLTGWLDTPDAPFSSIAQCFLYLGPQANLHANTTVKGFVSEEIFKKYKQYYELSLGQSFLYADEADKYIREHRWPSAN